MKLYSLEQVARTQPADFRKIEATTDADIERHIAEDSDTAPDLGSRDPSEFVARSPDLDVRTIRKRLGITQEEFASRFGINIWTLREWEQHRREPDGPAQALLKVIAHNPAAVAEAIAAK
ncbi:helix-turn-helix domain-containing protein [Skermanella mucosa]|uniref:helix-turn-helix domain-containing protein n=1 Tax=Skermanella mucosa TaxID=1789672 RepID=UPI00192C3C84|nr:helix-turn-helix domain-containing protein [Skermanella mucosa]UEM20055.1 helix-turn-helix domain-containing protein [Skermanella mucosa]